MDVQSKLEEQNSFPHISVVKIFSNPGFDLDVAVQGQCCIRLEGVFLVSNYFHI